MSVRTISSFGMGINVFVHNPLSEKLLNYQRDNSLENFQSDVFKYLEDEKLYCFVEENLDAHD